MELFIEQAKPFPETLDIKKILGHRVLSKSGEVIGRVSQVRFDAEKGFIEGVVVRTLPKFSKLYVCHTYISKITTEAVLLKMDPASLYVGRKVVSADGKRFGKVLSVQRTEHTNNILSFVVRRNFLRTVTIDKHEFTKLASSLILKKTYDDAKRSFTP